MTYTRSPVAWLRTLAGLLILAGALALSGCGGGSGAPNNEFKPFLLLNSAGGAAIELYSGIPDTLVVSGGLSPYRVTSSNAVVLPVTQADQYSPIVLVANAVISDTVVQVTVQDSMGRVAVASVVVHPAPMVNTLTITPNSADCGTNAICSGQTGTAQVTIIGSTPGRQVRFDVVSGPFGIVSTAPGTPIVPTLTVTSDAAGHATVILRANNDAPTQFAQLRATDLTSGQHVTASFLIQQVTDGSAVLSVVPDEATITGAFKGECSSGFTVDYFIYGGTPPYRVSSTFPNAVTIVNSTVPASGLAFRAITNGMCVDPLTFTIVDATGLQVTATLVNTEGSAERPAPPAPPLSASISPSTVTGCVPGQHFFPVITGGTAPYSVLPSGSPVTVPLITSTSGGFDISNLTSVGGPNVYNFNVTDASTPAQTDTFTITCNP
jgi:hypothetical protein